MVIPHRRRCLLVTAYRSLYEAPALPDLIPRTGTRKGQPVGDPINLIIEGSTEDLDAAFITAGWSAPHASTIKALGKEAVAVIVGKPGGAAPISTQYFEGHPQDLSYELPGPNARIRHHLRLWLVDTARGIWAGAANQDIGLLIKPLRLPTHRISPDIDTERDFIVRALEASGCADLLDYVTIPDAPESGRNATGQRFRTDGRAAVIRARPCTAPELVSPGLPRARQPG
jgi:LssY-like putative type I secretion system component LssY